MTILDKIRRHANLVPTYTAMLMRAPRADRIIRFNMHRTVMVLHQWKRRI